MGGGSWRSKARRRKRQGPFVSFVSFVAPLAASRPRRRPSDRTTNRTNGTNRPAPLSTRACHPARPQAEPGCDEVAARVVGGGSWRSKARRRKRQGPFVSFVVPLAASRPRRRPPHRTTNHTKSTNRPAPLSTRACHPARPQAEPGSTRWRGRRVVGRGGRRRGGANGRDRSCRSCRSWFPWRRLGRADARRIEPRTARKARTGPRPSRQGPVIPHGRRPIRDLVGLAHKIPALRG